jgi:hypothetical protein
VQPIGNDAKLRTPDVIGCTDRFFSPIFDKELSISYTYQLKI